MPINTNIMTEYFEFVKLLDLDKDDLKEIALKAVDSIFDESQKEKLKTEISWFK